jgi:hypothetical protein
MCEEVKKKSVTPLAEPGSVDIGVEQRCKARVKIQNRERQNRSTAAVVCEAQMGPLVDLLQVAAAVELRESTQ